MRDRIASDAKQLGIQLLAIDPHEKWSASYLLKEVGLSSEDVNYPLLIDPAQIVSATYGVAFQMRIHTEISNRPATFLIDKAGILRHAWRARSYDDRPTPAEVLEKFEEHR